VPDAAPSLASYSAEGPDRHYIVLRTDVEAEGPNPHRIAFHSYVLTILSAKTNRELPMWFTNGLAAVMSTAVTKGKTIEVGGTIPPFARTLGSSFRLSVPELVAVNRASPWFTDDKNRPAFNATSWAFVHMLMLGDKYSAQFDRYWHLILEGKTPAAAAFAQTLGNVDELDRAFGSYLKATSWPVGTKIVDTVADKVTPQAQPATDADVAALRASFLAVTRHPIEARAALASIKSEPRPVTAYEAEGLVADVERQADAALAAYANAIAGSSKNFYAYLRWAMLTRDRPQPSLVDVTEKLEHAIALNGDYGLAHRMLGQVQWQRGLRDWAVASLRHAVEVEPGETLHHQVLAQMLASTGQRSEAETQATEAVSVARSDDERRGAERVLATVRQPAPPTGIVGGIPGGVAGGGRGGVATSVAQGAPPPPPPPANAVRVGGSIRTPTRTKYVIPVYPPIARNARVQGVVTLEATIGPDGRVQDARVLRSIPLLDQAALDAVKQWEFTPTLVDGKTVPVISAVTVNFSLPPQ
jgi:TonB family protein